MDQMSSRFGQIREYHRLEQFYFPQIIYPYSARKLSTLTVGDWDNGLINRMVDMGST